MNPQQALAAWRVLAAPALALALLGPGLVKADSEPAVAGVDPSRRPEGAPRKTTLDKDAAWYRQALTGVSRPYPASLRFLEDQGAWHIPFTRPGMTGPYDIRNWHPSAPPDGNQDVARR